MIGPARPAASSEMTGAQLSAPSRVGARAEEHQPQLPADCKFVIHVAGGLDGAVRVAMMLRGRNYRVRELAIDVREGAAVSEVRIAVSVNAAEAELLLKRLQRMPAVVIAENI